MRLIHLSDLHLGKRVNEYSMLDDQRYILAQILDIIDQEHPDAVLIAGDIYDKPIPPAEAVQLFDDFLVQLAQRKLQVFAISGNHDSPERIAFGSRLMDPSGIHLSPVYHGTLSPIPLEDEWGTVWFYLLPFLKPAHVRTYESQRDVKSYDDAMDAVLSKLTLNPAERHVLVTHQFVTGANRCDSEEVSLGGADNVDAAHFDAFDYVALGHLHGPQCVGRNTVRYCGTPLKYSFSEVHHHKSVTVVDLQEKGTVNVDTVPLVPLHDLRELRGTFHQLTHQAFEGDSEDYLHITLTDEEDIADAVGRLRTIYPNLMVLDYDNTRTRQQATISGADVLREQSPMELFSAFYEAQNNQPMNAQQTAFVQKLMEDIWEGAV